MLLCAIPFLPFVGLSGVATYRQLIDHFLGAPIYRALLTEWMSPLSSDGWLAILPLHVTTFVGLMCMMLARERIRALPLTMFVLGAALAYSSRRFLPMLAWAIVPGMAGYLTAVIKRVSGRTRSGIAVCGLAIAVAYTGLTVRTARRRNAESVFESHSSPKGATRFIALNAPVGSRVFNAFDDGPWLMWFGSPGVRHYVDPRNDLGAAALVRYTELLARPDEFDATSRQLSINLALVPRNHSRTSRLAAHLAGARDWDLVYWDDGYVVFARRVEENATLLADHAAHAPRPTSAGPL
jgi:hypothetical protein